MLKDQRKIISEEEVRAAIAYALEMQSGFHLPSPISFVGDTEAGHIQKLSQSAVAWYEPATDTICVNTERMKSVCESKNLDIRAFMGETIFHEAIGHYGLRLLLAEQFEETMLHIYDHADSGLSHRLMKKRGELEEMLDARGKAIHRNTPEVQMRVLAVEEFMSDMAEHLHGWHPQRRSLLFRFAHRLGDALKALCFPYSTVSMRDMERILEQSYQKVKSRSYAGKIADYLAVRFPKTAFLQSFVAKHTLQSRNIQEGKMPDAPKSLSPLIRVAYFIGFVLAPYVALPLYMVKRREGKGTSPMSCRNVRSVPQTQLPIAREILRVGQFKLAEEESTQRIRTHEGSPCRAAVRKHVSNNEREL